ncbi:D-alanyl-D-alanine carboxypeptidase/D-alanyl-D-alanine-endopeptidase [soil metagenome]
MAISLVLAGSRPRAALRLALLALLAACAPAAPARAPAPGSLAALGPEIATIFADTVFAHAHWGVVVRSLGTGETIHRQNGGKLFMPASNMKLITGAAVLEALGPDFRYRTEVAAAGPVQNGVLRGDWVVRGGGDPSISERFGDGEARTVFRAWADSLRAHGVTRVAGAIVGVDEYFDGVPYGRGWAWDDLEAYYSAPVAGLQYNEGAIRVQVFPGRQAGEPGIISLNPPTGHVRIVNETRTVEPGRPPRLRYTHSDAAGTLLVSGEIPSNTVAVERDVAVREPTRFFVTALRETLREAGIQVEGPAVLPGDRDEEGLALGRIAPLFVHHSAPMREIIPAFMKPSQNQMAEMLLKTLGRELRGTGSVAAGVQVVDSLFRGWGFATERQLLMADGSGLSRYNYVSPDLLMELLEHMTRSPNWETWYASLPIAGVDGTLRARMRDTPAEGNVHGKTGTLSSVRALSGYVTTANGERLIFSMIVNGHALSASDADRLVDTALSRLAGFQRRGLPAGR